MYVIVIKSKRTGIQTMMSLMGGVQIFNSHNEALAVADSIYGKDNAEVEYDCYEMKGMVKLTRTN